MSDIGERLRGGDIVERLRESGLRSEIELHEDREEAAARIRELEAQVGDLGAIKEKAHRQGYEQGKAAGDAFGAAIREHVKRLEDERDALQAKLAKTAIAEAVAAEREAIAAGIEAKIGQHVRPQSLTAMAFRDIANAIRARTNADALAELKGKDDE